MNDSQLDEEAIFCAARQIDATSARDAYLRQVCGEDAALFDRVALLLTAHAEDSGFLESPGDIFGSTVNALVLAETPGTCIGPYKLLEQIGVGGMGLVFMAEQQLPLRRMVALKIIKPGMDTRQVIARFEAERQALALMDPPHIAKVLDAGATDSGRPYFVMELVRGIPVTEYCDQARLPTRERLRLFISICEAVQHAHQKGIIHRDLKPSNILVTMHDDKPVPKVIDFGVAKATNQRLVEQTLFTNFAQMIGTPTYMSPEQAQMSGLDVDTRSDVYSLGVLLYELLTGSTPFDTKRLREAGYDELRRIIRDEEPPRPSMRVTALDAATQSTNAENRTLDRRKFSQTLRGDLDWIVMKALEKDRTRRYETASAFAADIEHYLHDEPVDACPPSVRYRLRKFARRNRTLLTTGCLIALALVAGTAVSVWQAIEADRSRKLAEANFQKALEAVDRMLIRVGDESLNNVPQLEQVQKKIYQDAVEFYEKLFVERPRDPKLRYETARAYMRLVDFHSFGVGDMDEWTKLRKALQRAHELYLELHAESPNDPKIRAGLADSIECQTWSLKVGSAMRESWARQAVELLLPVAKDYRDQLALTYRSLGSQLSRQGRYKEAEQTYRLALDLGVERETTYRALAQTLDQAGRGSEAIAALQQSVALWPNASLDSKSGGKWRHYEWFQSHQLLGKMLMRAQRPEEALPHLTKAVEMAARLVTEFPSLALYRNAHFDSRTELIRAYQQLGKPKDALQFVNELQPRSAGDYVARAKLYQTLERTAEELSDYEKAIQLDKDNAEFHNNFAWLLATCPDPQFRDAGRAVELATKAVALVPHASSYWNTLGVAQYRAGDWKAAIAALKKSEELAPDKNASFNAFFLAMSHWQLGEKDKARKWFDQAVGWMDKNKPKDEELIRFRAEAESLLKDKSGDAVPR